MINGTLVSYYFICKRRLWLHAHGIRQEHESEAVKIGKYYHEEMENERDKDKFINEVKVDKIEGDYVIEYKKSNSSVEASKWQLLFYLWKLKEVGIEKKGLLKFKENRDNIEVELAPDKEKKLLEIMDEIKELLKQPTPPSQKYCTAICSRSAYRDFNRV